MANITALLRLHDDEAVLAVISDYYLVDENDYVKALLGQLPMTSAMLTEQEQKTAALITGIRGKAAGGSGIDSFLQEYSLGTHEGITLMCLAESLLRIPDRQTMDALIADKLTGAAWHKHVQKSDSLFVNASTWGLMLSGKVVALGQVCEDNPGTMLGRLIDRLGEPVIRAALLQAMKIMGKQFVAGRNIREALKASRENRQKGYTHSFDMLGEAALTDDDAKRYQQSYIDAIAALGKERYTDDLPKPSISIKLSALHPRYEESQRHQVLDELYHRVLTLILAAKDVDIALTIDAEEMDRLELSLALFKKCYLSPVAKGWGNLGLAVQAYSSRALPVLHWLNCLGKAHDTPIPVRLVKGAYWDSEIKWCQQLGLSGYPVFTRKVNTDISYSVCAWYLLSQAQDSLYPQFATHNAQTVISILDFSAKYDNAHFEFQRLHGMGDELYNEILGEFRLKQHKSGNHPLFCRIYAPVGAHQDLLPYLVRRLLENGANTSFVHKLLDASVPVAQLAASPVQQARQRTARGQSLNNADIASPPDIFLGRQNSAGINLAVASQRQPFFDVLASFSDKTYEAASIINGKDRPVAERHVVASPYDRRQVVGSVSFADEALARESLNSAKNGVAAWQRLSIEKRAAIVERIADIFEQCCGELVSLCIREAGKIIRDGIDEVREAVDFCRYYAQYARQHLSKPLIMPGPTGESNTLEITGRGVFLCISPWNFPLAIFTGQVVAALVSGNAVLAKPAEATSLIAYRAVQLMHQAGVPEDVLQLLCGRGDVVGQAIAENTDINGICFTGSMPTARRINRTIADRDGAIIPLIAETGGQNAMIVDSTALPEQVVVDALQSAFLSAGQRCSALRVLYLQDDIADKVITLLEGAMAALVVGDSSEFTTDIGSVIDADAQARLLIHIATMKKTHRLLAEANIASIDTSYGYFVPPTAIEIDSIRQLEKEHFGPILHIIRFKRSSLATVIDDINGTGYGLTFGVHSRNASFCHELARKIQAGNIYINRNQVGAVVGVQPFGGQGLSGTGPKAGGPHYLLSFIGEKTISNNTTAVGGNAALLAMGASK